MSLSLVNHPLWRGNHRRTQEYFNSLFKQGIEEMLQSELDQHLGYAKHAVNGYNTGNSRNGSFPKTITTENVGSPYYMSP